MNQGNGMQNQYNAVVGNPTIGLQGLNNTNQGNINYNFLKYLDPKDIESLDKVKASLYSRTGPFELHKHDYVFTIEGIGKYLRKNGFTAMADNIKLTKTDERSYSNIMSKLRINQGIIQEALNDDLILYEILVKMKNREESNCCRHHTDKLKTICSNITALAYKIGPERLMQNHLPFLYLMTNKGRTMPLMGTININPEAKRLPVPQIAGYYQSSCQPNATIGAPRTFGSISDKLHEQPTMFSGLNPTIKVPGMIPNLGGLNAEPATANNPDIISNGNEESTTANNPDIISNGNEESTTANNPDIIINGNEDSTPMLVGNVIDLNEDSDWSLI